MPWPNSPEIVETLPRTTLPNEFGDENASQRCPPGLLGPCLCETWGLRQAIDLSRFAAQMRNFKDACQPAAVLLDNGIASWNLASGINESAAI